MSPSAAAPRRTDHGLRRRRTKQTVLSSRTNIAARRVRWLGLAALALCGCSREEGLRLADYLEELEFDVPLESATYVPLGRFDIPLAAAPSSDDPPAGGSPSAESPVWMRVQFELTAETTPHWEKAIAAAADAHRGALSDAVLTVVRTSEVHDLADPRLAAVNTRLSDIVRPMLGEDRVRRLMFNKLDQAAIEAASKKKGHGEHGPSHEGGHGQHETEPATSGQQDHGGHH